ncbi:hypothetical protein [Flindersiella endophytica]
MRGLIDLQAGLIRATREGIVEVCRQTAARINAEQAEAERRDRDLLNSAVSAVFATVAGAVTGASWAWSQALCLNERERLYLYLAS